MPVTVVKCPCLFHIFLRYFYHRTGQDRTGKERKEVNHIHSRTIQICEVCDTEEAKYRCPGCLKYSCSLPCVKKHKTASNCNGVREKTAYVSVTEFSDLNLLSDYRFLEELGRLADCAARDDILHRPSSNKFINLLKNRARRCNICLKTSPVGFTKRDQIFFILHWVPDDKLLSDILKLYLDPQEADPVILQRLKIYTMAPQSDIQILMKVENRPHNSIRYEELDTKKSLLDNLKGKVVLEYPTLHVVLKKFNTDMIILGHGKNISYI
uniref:Box C/D snoRNA protein 1 n=1 Tax=Salvator merianae TaxID=96440 RepID=A0A8D0DVI0_SALMN